MGSTAGGLPYPDDDQPLADMALAVKALADAVETALNTRLRTKVIVGSATTDANGYATITHNAGFTPTYAAAALDRTTGALYNTFMFDSFGATTVRTRIQDAAGNMAPGGTVVPYRVLVAG